MSERSDKIGGTRPSHPSIDIAEVLKLADELLFTHTGEHLDHLQEIILTGTLKGHKYAKIASENNLSEGHVRDTASELWQALSDVLGEDVNKLNARNVLGRTIISNNLYLRQERSPKPSPLPKPTENKSYFDIDTAPEITEFHGKTQELNILKTWLIQDCSRLITLFGIIGIGKTTLAIKLIEQIQPQFEYVVYRRLRYSPNIDDFLTDLLQSFISSSVPTTLDRKINVLLKFLRKHRCLIIIDDLQMLFQQGQLAGQYQAEFEDYYLVFKQIAELPHASSLLLITNEQPEDAIATRHKFTRSLKLVGMRESAKQILRDQELSDEQMWDTLIEKYQGHPLWLEMTATMIQELFAGRVTEFLAYPDLILSNAIASQLSRLWIRLSESEKQVMNYLAKQEDAVTLSQLLQEISHSPTELLKAIQSLKRRCLLEDTSNLVRASNVENYRSALLKINPIFKNYLSSLS